MRSILMLASFFLLCLPASSSADSDTSTDAQAVVNALLATVGPVPVTTTTYTAVTAKGACHHVHHGGSHGMGDDGDDWCDPDTVTQDRHTTVETRLLSATVIRMVGYQINYGQPAITSLPESVSGQFNEYVNCTQDNQTAHVSVNFQTSHTNQVTMSKSITHAVGVRIGVSASFDGFGVNSSLDISNSGTTTGLRSKRRASSSTTRQYTDDVVIRPNVDVVAQLLAHKNRRKGAVQSRYINRCRFEPER